MVDRKFSFLFFGVDGRVHVHKIGSAENTFSEPDHAYVCPNCQEEHVESAQQRKEHANRVISAALIEPEKLQEPLFADYHVLQESLADVVAKDPELQHQRQLEEQYSD